MKVGKSEIIRVDGHKFKMTLTDERDGYNYTFHSYDLHYDGKLIAKDVGSIKMCYFKAYTHVENIRMRVKNLLSE